MRVRCRKLQMPIFKYLTPERLDALANAHIRFTQPGSFNDPFEAFPYFKQITPDEHIGSLINENNKDKAKIEKMLEESWQKQLDQHPGLNIPFDFVKPFMKSMMVQSMPFINRLFRDFMGMRDSFSRNLALHSLLKGMNKEIGILSLTEKSDNLLMWSHYSSDHSGFVIEFDETNPFFDQRSEKDEITGHLKKVRYSLERPEIILYDPQLSNDENADNWINNIFWVKSKHWEYEQEWRMTYTLRDCQRVVPSSPYDICLFPFPKKSINKIYIGCRTPKNISDEIQKINLADNDYSHVKILRAIINEREYKLDFINV